MLHDDLIHGAWAGTRSVRRIEAETPVLPHVIAACVVDEAAAHLGEPLPASWVRELAARADTLFTHNRRVRRRLKGAGNQGRDWLWAFMRHWLAGRLHDQRPDCLAKLPPDFAAGHPPPSVRSR
jgi:hypothetical protein